MCACLSATGREEDQHHCPRSPFKLVVRWTGTTQVCHTPATVVSGHLFLEIDNEPQLLVLQEEMGGGV